MAKQGYVIGFRWAKGADVEKIKSILAPKGDWAFLNQYFWLYQSELSVEQIRALIMPLINMADDSVLVIEANFANRSGWVPKVIIDWLGEADKQR